MEKHAVNIYQSEIIYQSELQILDFQYMGLICINIGKHR